MERVQEIKSAREKRFYEARMKGKGAQEKALAEKDLKEGIDLVISPVVRNKEQVKQTVASKVTEKVRDSCPRACLVIFPPAADSPRSTPTLFQH